MPAAEQQQLVAELERPWSEVDQGIALLCTTCEPSQGIRPFPRDVVLIGDSAQTEYCPTFHYVCVCVCTSL